jgi:exocyst complex component 4
MSDARSSLQEAKETLGSKRADLVQMWSRGQTLEEMLRLLDQMFVGSLNIGYHVDFAIANI